jgi:DNA-binding transcriptional MerR regulator
MRTYQVKEVARLAGISVRTLHHYDHIDLLVPSDRTRAGYRLYTDDDLLRLQQILIQRELGMPLEQIRRALDDPSYDRRAALLRQREELAARVTRAQDMLRAIDTALSLLGRDPSTMNTNDDMKPIFDGFADETRERWGNTDAYKISQARVSGYGEADWRALQSEQDAIYADLARVLAAGLPADGDDATAIAERHRLSIDRWFYPCSSAQHAALADLYEADPRFAASIDRHGAGLTPFLAAAIRENSRK